MKIQLEYSAGKARPVPIQQLASAGYNESAPGTPFEPPGPRRIIAHIDFSLASRAVLRKAAELARETHARLTMLYVQPQGWFEEDASNPMVADSYRDLGEAAIGRLNRLAEEEVEGDIELEATFRVGEWARIVVETARREKADLIVTAGRERVGLARVLPYERLARVAPCPVVFLSEHALAKRPQAHPTVQWIVVAASLSEHSRQAVKHAANLALQLNRKLMLLHVMADRELGSRLQLGNSHKLQSAAFESVRQTLLGWITPETAAGLKATVRVRTGFSAEWVLGRQLAVLNPELIVIGNSPRHWFGTRHVRVAMRSATAPVVVVGPECPPEPRPWAPALAGPRRVFVRRPAAGEHKRILIVDDDPSVRESLDKLFKGEHCDVTLAADGQDVIGKVDPGQFDLALLDLKMRGANGWTTLRHLHAINPRLPVVLITGLPDRYRLAASAGVDALVEKPVDVPVLLETVQSLLETPRWDAASASPGPGSCRHIRSSSENARRQIAERYTTPYLVK